MVGHRLLWMLLWISLWRVIDRFGWPAVAVVALIAVGVGTWAACRGVRRVSRVSLEKSGDGSGELP
jgi:hypothetical protein